MNKARGDFGAEVLSGQRIIVMGGETTNGTANGKAQAPVLQYSKAPSPRAMSPV
jgi:hypothetical protein